MSTTTQDQACIRARHAVWTTCRCTRCIVDVRRIKKVQEHGRYRRVPSTAAWDVIDRLRTAGWTSSAIASATGIPESTVTHAVRRGRDGWAWGPRHSAAIINHGTPTTGQVGAYGSRRRLQALAALGWTLDALTARTGLGFTTLAAIRSGVTTRVGVTLANQVAAVFDELHMVPGPSIRSRQHAASQGWVSALAWDDIDDPAEVPNIGGRLDGRSSSLIDDLEHLLDTAGPWTWQGITSRLGVTKSGIEQACGPGRGNRRDLLERIQRQDRGVAA